MYITRSSCSPCGRVYNIYTREPFYIISPYPWHFFDKIRIRPRGRHGDLLKKCPLSNIRLWVDNIGFFF